LEPVEVSWKPREEGDSLLINRVEIRYTNNEDTLNRLKRLKLGAQIRLNPIKVILPDIPHRFPPRLPKFPGVFLQIYDSLTGPEHEVTYVYKNRQLRRYLLRCSSKGTKEFPEYAKYWLDGVFLGTWEDAKPRFESFRWEDDAVADIVFDQADFQTSEGVLYLRPDLRYIFSKHRITWNIHPRYRDASDR